MSRERFAFGDMPESTEDIVAQIVEQVGHATGPETLRLRRQGQHVQFLLGQDRLFEHEAVVERRTGIKHKPRARLELGH